MTNLFQPWQFLVAVLCGWVNQRQQDIIEFQNAQIAALLQRLGKKRVLLDDDQRRVLAVKAKAIGRKALLELTTIVTPNTIIRWHRELVAKKWDHAEKRRTVGRPRLRQMIVDLILKFERWMRSLKSECVDRMIFFGRKSLERALRNYVEHYHLERNHQGLGNELIEPGDHVGRTAGNIQCRERLGGMLRYYYRDAA